MSSRQQAVRDALAASGSFLSAQDLHGRLRDAGVRMGLTTVYRTLQLLAGGGRADVVVREDGQRAYRVCASGAHDHHLICRRCGSTAEVQDAALGRRHRSPAWIHRPCPRRRGFRGLPVVLGGWTPAGAGSWAGQPVTSLVGRSTREYGCGSAWPGRSQRQQAHRPSTSSRWLLA